MEADKGVFVSCLKCCRRSDHSDAILGAPIVRGNSVALGCSAENGKTSKLIAACGMKRLTGFAEAVPVYRVRGGVLCSSFAVTLQRRQQMGVHGVSGALGVLASDGIEHSDVLFQ